MNHYEILQVDWRCSADEIKSQYRALAMVCHPDQNQDDVDGATEQLRRLNEAYEVLSDPVKRRAYDLTLDMRPSARAQRTGPSSGDTYQRSNGPQQPPPMDRDYYPASSGTSLYRRSGLDPRITVLIILVSGGLWSAISHSVQTPDDQPPTFPAEKQSPATLIQVSPEQRQMDALRSQYEGLLPEVAKAMNVGNRIVHAPMMPNGLSPGDASQLAADLDRLRQAQQTAGHNILITVPQDTTQSRAAVQQSASDIAIMISSGRQVVSDIRSIPGIRVNGPAPFETRPQ